MREAEFKAWMAESHTPGTVSTQLSKVRKLERHFGDLDEIFVGGSFMALKRWISVIAVGSIIVLVLGLMLGRYMPDIVTSEDVPEEGQSADVDFPVVLKIKGGMLEVAYVSGTRAFPKSADPTILGKSISYCREKAMWTVPYKITYRLKLGERWPLRYHNGTLFARVPELDPSLPVAIDTEKLAKGPEESCWFVPDMGTRDRALKSISPQLNTIAKSQNTKNFAREKSRQTVVEFLRTWAFNQKEYIGLRPDAKIVVIFAGE